MPAPAREINEIPELGVRLAFHSISKGSGAVRFDPWRIVFSPLVVDLLAGGLFGRQSFCRVSHRWPSIP